ncbi:cytochrome P450 [Periconia macrospinosa]|uniref:Cytochrome P450 n=1 Tax=Periconia macrospinosa TaxID=97972 RepID=A0A2V1DWF7_9PLEO|nr:cytochrome P450 [Periconia macrospinosa]
MDLPSVPYRFPNGQGNVAKFLQGESQSRIWQMKMGSIYRIWARFSSEVVLTRPEHLQVVFKDSHMHLKGKSMNSGWLCGEILGSCIGLLNQSDWEAARTPFISTFHRNKSPSYIPLIQERVRRQFNKIEAENHPNEKAVILNPSKDLKLLPLWVLCDIIYGDLTEAMEKQFEEIIPLRESLWRQVISGKISRFTLSQYLPTSTNRDLRLFKEKWDRFNDDAYRRAKVEYPNHPIVGFYEAVEENTMTRKKLLHTLDEALFANLDVTIGNFSWNPIFLAAHQNIQSDLRVEIQAAKKESTDDSLTSYLSSTSTLLMACVLESARLKPMASFSIPQAAPTDRILDNFIIPAGTSFIVDTYGLNVLDPYWGKDNTQYRPARFLEHKSAGELRYRFWRYGFGPRQCLGKNVADVVIKTALAYMVDHYNLRIPAEDGNSTGNWDRVADTWISVAGATIVCDKSHAR